MITPAALRQGHCFRPQIQTLGLASTQDVQTKDTLSYFVLCTFAFGLRFMVWAIVASNFVATVWCPCTPRRSINKWFSIFDEIWFDSPAQNSDLSPFKNLWDELTPGLIAQRSQVPKFCGKPSSNVNSRCLCSLFECPHTSDRIAYI